MTDHEAVLLEIEASDLRRHFRLMSRAKACRTFFRLLVGSLFLNLGESLITPHVSRRTRRALDNAMHLIANDRDIATEGWAEAAEISRKTLDW